MTHCDETGLGSAGRRSVWPAENRRCGQLGYSYPRESLDLRCHQAEEDGISAGEADSLPW